MTAAGIAVKVLTGDNERVARHVFAEIGVPVTGVLTGDALTHLSEEALPLVPRTSWVAVARDPRPPRKLPKKELIK